MAKTNMYVDVIEVAVSMILVMAIGFLASKFKMFEGPAFGGFGKFSGKIAFPMLLFESLAGTAFKNISVKPLVNSLLSSLCVHVLCLVVFLFKFQDKTEIYLATVCASCYINYIIIGLPIFRSIWGTNYDSVPAIASFANCIISVPLFIIGTKLWSIKKEKERVAQEYANAENKEEHEMPDIRTKPKDILMAFYATIKSPIVIGNCLGIIWSAIGVKPPIFLSKITTYYGACVGYLSLIGLGRFLHQHSLIACHWTHLVVSLVLRFIIFPLFALAFAFAFKLEGRLARQCIVLGMLPTANSAFILAESTGCGAAVVSTVILWSLILIVPIILLWNYILNHYNLFPDNLSDIVVS